MHKVINIDNYILLDFTANNHELAEVDLVDTAKFSNYVFDKIYTAGAKMGIGGYMEPRVIYRRSEHFSTEDEIQRNIHLGIDLWAEAGTTIFSPLMGKVHSFKNNANFGDYGPTIILEHTYAGKPLYTLYGHLSLASLDGLFEGKSIQTGEKIAEIGNYPVNGDWPPHLHFQVMTDLLGMYGDFPGVCTEGDKEQFEKICLNPDFLLGL
ncbi:peptidoglycan DD-metalloendopeptidase family protein [Emticicia sp. BO119]|uniref:peptidoglycan DD-metalloendopeptidase family protein n=1 Tax=Emticicia sp. BO119 TaxID=2757768 RepID=UPI0015F04A8E|nr:peptidoglycan DD-metalloendopeptidase family protein [Emticicia sp. BO119]MBA4848859.1 peptidoglycan DD-metalloendopeptidase family protein [Emticicia sp. BO119]